MLARTKKHLTKQKTIFCLSENGHVLQLPTAVVKQLISYEIHDHAVIEKVKSRIKKIAHTETEKAFAHINQKYGKKGALIKAIRLREGMNQLQFAKAIQITQGDLSKIEHGRRAIGKELIARISKAFGIKEELLK